VISSTPLFEMRKAQSQGSGTVPFEEIRNLGRTQARRSGNEDMNLIQIRFEGEELEIMPLTALRHEFLRRFLHLSRQHLASIFGNPHEVIGDARVSPAGFSLLHPGSSSGKIAQVKSITAEAEAETMQTVHIYRLNDLDRRTRERLKAAQMEAARVWMDCVEWHRQARAEQTRWPNRDELQRRTKGGKYALHSQSTQMVCQQFLANVDTIKQLRQTNPRHRYPYRPKKYMTVDWPAQAVARKGKRVILPMGRGRSPLSFHLADLPPQTGAVSLVWNGGYELHIVVPYAPSALVSPADRALTPTQPSVQATVDLGEIHQAAVTTSTGKALIVTGRGIRSLKRQHNQALGRLSRLQARCQKGSKRWRRLQYAREREKGKKQRRVRDLRHKGTRQVVDFCQAEGVQTLYVGDPHGVRTENRGRHHNQRMAQWEYGKDQQYLAEKCEKVGIVCFSGSERGTSSHCPRCGWKKKPKGRNWTCRRCGFVGHRDVVGSMNMHPIAFGSRIGYPTSLTYRRPGPLRDRRLDKQRSPGGTS
jgi:putative transposase